MQNNYRFLFHLHTFKSYDATISYKQLYTTIIEHNITHLAITEHNNIDSYKEFKEYIKKRNVNVILIPAVEYTTKIGDIIALNINELIVFDTYLDLIKKIRQKNGYVILPHPFKRKEYPSKLYEYLDFYEVLNMRGVGRNFDSSSFNNIKQIFGSDAHNGIELPGVINVFNSNEKFFDALNSSTIIPEIHTSTLKLHKFVNKIISKIKRKFFK